MARFAQECLKRLGTLLRRLEVELGPDTGKWDLQLIHLKIHKYISHSRLIAVYVGDLAIRIGIHSGPVTAGVLRGERARFQLFGDVS